MDAVGNGYSEKGLLEPLTRREQEILDLLAEGLTGSEIAERLTLAVSSVRWYIQQIYGKLGVNGKWQAIARAGELGLIQVAPGHNAFVPGNKPGQPAEFPPLAHGKQPHHNFPFELTPFIGRQAEVGQVQLLLKEHRLVTLTGSGGVGKTRLSIQVARRLLPEFADGTWFVELAPVTDPDLIAQTVAAVLGLRVERSRSVVETISLFLSSREVLLVLDNCEHVLIACAGLVDVLLRKAPRLRILTSSREALGIFGEYSFRVPSMTVPDAHLMTSKTRLEDFEGVQLFVERARAVLPGFAIDEHNAAAVADICRRMDGIPLALELAAARLSVLTPEQLASRLDHAFRLLTGGSRTALPRQQTLRATIDWSYRLLSIQEQVLLRRLAVFSGGGNLEAIEAICAGEGIEAEQVIDLLEGLVNKSLVSAERQLPGSVGSPQEKPAGEMRYDLLETMRQYTREKLYDSGEMERLRDRHLEYYVALCEIAEPQLQGAGRLECFRRLKGEHDNLREALEWSFHDATMAVQGLRVLAAIAIFYWFLMGKYTEVTRWLNVGLSAAGEDIPSLLKAKVFFLLGCLSPQHGQVNPAFEECIALCRQIGPQANRVLCLALANYHLSDYETSVAQAKEAVRIARELGPAGRWELGEALFYYAVRLFLHPQNAYDDQAFAAAEEHLRISQTGDRWNVGGYWLLGYIQTFRGQVEEARKSFENALRIFSELEEYGSIAFSLFNLAMHHRLAGQYALSQQYCQKLYQHAHAGANLEGYCFFLYETGMLLVYRLSEFFSKNEAQAGQDAVKLLSFVSKMTDEYRQYGWYGRIKTRELQAVGLLRDHLGEQVYTRAWGEGQALSLEEAVALALTLQIQAESLIMDQGTIQSF